MSQPKMKKLIKKAIKAYAKDKCPTDPAVITVYEFIGLMKVDEGMDFISTGEMLIAELYEEGGYWK